MSYIELLFLLMLAAVGYWYLWDGLRGKIHPMRILPAYTAIEDAIDKAVEEGKPVFISPGGIAYLSGMYASMTLAGISTVKYAVRMAVRKGAQVRLPAPHQPEILPLLDGIYRQIAIEEGKPEAYNRDNIRYFGNLDLTYGSGVMSWEQVDGVSAYICVGAAGGGVDTDPIFIARHLGAITIGGTPRWLHQANFTMLMHYPLHMDDVYAMGALCSQDPIVMSNMSGGDLVKVILFGLTIALTALALVGIPVYGKTGWLGR